LDKDKEEKAAPSDSQILAPAKSSETSS